MVYSHLVDLPADPVAAWAAGQVSFIPGLLPAEVIAMPAAELIALLRMRWGAAVDLALDPELCDPASTSPRPAELRGPVAGQADGSWLRTANVVGVNVRTVGSFWGVVAYSLTLPAAQSAIHLLPIWEPGVVGSIYGMSSWQLNRELFSPELAAACPWLATPDHQLRAVVNLLHVMGRAVGMDVIPHTDRFSEMALAYPGHFEWLRRQGNRIVDHRADLHVEAQAAIAAWLRAVGPAAPAEVAVAELFAATTGEEQRLRLLFGHPADAANRLARRIQLIKHLHRLGLETVPATMAPPYRGLEVDPAPAAHIRDEHGMEWRDYRMTQPQPMSRVFGPLARFKLYEARDDNAAWTIDFDRPRAATWRYVVEHYAAIQRSFGFDFMRGDMSHVQMRPAGVPALIDDHYDILGAVKARIRRHAPHFAYFAETFLAPRDSMAYGDEIDHLEAAGAEVTLGDLQSTAMGSPEFLHRLRRYDDIRRTRTVAPSFTVMTADKDDPRFDAFYRSGNVARLFLALFLADMPSYMALGFELRDRHDAPAPNEHYTKLYVFQERAGPKATRGPYVWGRNAPLYAALTRLRLTHERLARVLAGQATRWLLPPDATGASPLAAWGYADAPLVCLVNTDGERPAPPFGLPAAGAPTELLLLYSSVDQPRARDERLVWNGVHYPLSGLAAGEARVYALPGFDINYGVA